MKKIMFDSNIFDVISGHIEKLEEQYNNYEFYITTIQTDELADIPDCKKEIRRHNLLMLAVLRAKIVPLSLVIPGYSRFNHSRFGEGDVYNKILNENKSNVKDAAIADTAVTEGCILVTNDIKLHKKMKDNEYEAMLFDEFIASL